jgi:hypothetical protein
VLRFTLRNHENVFGSGECRKHTSHANVLILGQDAFGAIAAAVINDVVGVSSGFVGAHLMLGCTLRVSAEILAYQDYAGWAWDVLPVSALIEMTAVTLTEELGAAAAARLRKDSELKRKRERPAVGALADLAIGFTRQPNRHLSFDGPRQASNCRGAERLQQFSLCKPRRRVLFYSTNSD